MPMVSAQDVRGFHGRFTRAKETAERDAIACEMRTRGMTYQQIADTLHVTKSSAHKMVERTLAAIVQEPAEAVRQLELDRLDAMYTAAMEVLERQHFTVSQGKVVDLGGQPLEDDGPVLQAIDRLLKIQERRARLLGLDSATKTEISGGVKYELVGIDPDTLT